MAEETSKNIIFSWNAKTMIGELRSLEASPQDFSNHDVKDYYFIAYPCVIDFSINRPKTGTATLEWKLIPLFYKALNQDDTQIMFAFSKS
jgi:hypothetical protein